MTRDTVRSLERALSILEMVASTSWGERLSDIASALQLPVSTVHRLLTTLEASGFVKFERESMKWRIGRAAAALGQSGLVTLQGERSGSNVKAGAGFRAQQTAQPRKTMREDEVIGARTRLARAVPANVPARSLQSL